MGYWNILYLQTMCSAAVECTSAAQLTASPIAAVHVHFATLQIISDILYIIAKVHLSCLSLVCIKDFNFNRPVEDRQGGLGVPVLGVGHPAAGLHLVAVQAPVLQLLLEQRPANVGGVVELASPVVIHYLTEHSWMPAERENIQSWIIISRTLEVISPTNP